MFLWTQTMIKKKILVFCYWKPSWAWLFSVSDNLLCEAAQCMVGMGRSRLSGISCIMLHTGSWASALGSHPAWGGVSEDPSVLMGTDPPFVSCSPPEPSVRHHLQLGRRVDDQHRPRQVCELDVHPQWEHARPSLLRILGFLLAVSFRVYSFPPLPPHCLIWNWIIDCSEDRMTPMDLISNPRISVSAFLWSKACLLKVMT